MTPGRHAEGVGHGRIELLEDRCTSCMICVRECPTWCISIDSHSEVIPDEDPIPGARQPARRRERTTNVLDSFDIDFTLCMYCGICIEECPFDALQWAGAHVAAGDSRQSLLHDRQALAPHGPDTSDEVGASDEVHASRETHASHEGHASREGQGAPRP